MARSYRHLTYEQRCQLYSLNNRGDSQKEMAVALNVSTGTISRELRRNRAESGDYHYTQAQTKTQERRKISNRKMSSEMLVTIEEKLKLNWSPVQISGWLKKQGRQHVSHEVIYRHIRADRAQGGALYAHLRHRGKRYNKQSKGTAGRGCIPGRIDIKERPAIVDQKTRLGDWELDTIIGSQHQGAIVSMVDKATKLTKLIRVQAKTADEVKNAIIKKLNPIRDFVLTLTSDNGKEFAAHQSISTALGAQFFFATPYHSWERGLNEHTNGLVRQYFPKSTNFHDLVEGEVEIVEMLLNNRPRKSLGFETPLEAFYRLRG